METIKASELRIGNYFKIGEYIHQVEIENIKDYKVFEPIPITEELLLEYGAEKISEGRFDFKDYPYGYFDLTKEELIITFQSQKMSEPIKYLHNLQNLYFALTNKELKKI